MAEKEQVYISFQEVILFLNVNCIIIFLGIILWYFIWIKEYGGVIPNPQIGNETNITYFNSKNFVIVWEQLWKRIKEFSKPYLIRSVGMESYIYLLFQRKLIRFLLTMSFFSLFFSLLTTLAHSEQSSYSAFHDFLLNNKYLDDFSIVIHVTSLILYTFLHFRFFGVIKRETKFLYFDRFDEMSRNKDADWLSCRTLHISGLGPNERNSKILYNYIS